MSDPCAKRPISGSNRTGASATSNAIDVVIQADPARVWKAIVSETDRWWLPDFRMAPGSRSVVLEPRLGGRWMELAGPGGDDSAGILWGTVVAIDPPRSLHLSGHICPPYGAAMFMIQIEVVPSAPPAKGCTVRVTHVEIGDMDDAHAREMASGWTRLFKDGLGAYCERG